MAKVKKFSPFKGDKTLWIIIALLSVASILVVYSSTASMAYREEQGDTSVYVLRQLRFVILGFLTTIVVHWINVDFFLKKAKLAFWISAILVLLTYVIGVNLNDAHRWIRIPIIGLTFSPSDPLKISLVMLLATLLGQRQASINKQPMMPDLSPNSWRRNPTRNLNIWRHTTRPILLPIAVAMLVVMPANLSTALLIAITAFLVMWVARVNRRELTRMFLVAMVSGFVIIGSMKLMGIGRAETWFNRIENFTTSIVGFGSDDSKEGTLEEVEDNFQKRQAQIAIASGGVLGKGPGNSTQRSQLPHPYSDFAYAFIIEEYGILGGVIILFLYLWLLYRSGMIIRRSKSSANSILVLGLVLTIILQAFVNICVSVGLFPVTGQSLPLISLGGSSILFTSVALGMILSVARENNERILLENAEKQTPTNS